MLPLISVVVANWNGRRYLDKCLSSLAAQTYPSVEITVVDNGSSDGSAAWIAEHFPAIQVIANPANRGFAVANNQGIARSRGAYVALLNNDAWAEPGWLAGLYAAAEQGTRVGMVASLMLSASQPERVDSTGICVDRCGISWDRGGGQSAAAWASGPLDVFGACAGAALYRRAMLDEVGGFDEDFFAYLEDVDLACRARWLGWQARYAPAARVYHIHSGTGGEGSAFKTYWLARNKFPMIIKNYPLPQLWQYLPLILLYDGLSLISALPGRQRWSAVRGRLAGWRAAPGAWRKRRARGHPALSAREMLALLGAVAWPWQVAGRYQHVNARTPPGGPKSSVPA
jgi:GT2 family glycosyltransferase